MSVKGSNFLYSLMNMFNEVFHHLTFFFFFSSACLQHNASCQEHDYGLEISFKLAHVYSVKFLLCC